MFLSEQVDLLYCNDFENRFGLG